MKYMNCLKICLIMFLFTTGCVKADATSDPNMESFTFVQMGDTQIGFGGYESDIKAFKQAVELINELEPNFVVFCGDTVEDFIPESINDFLEIKSDLKAPLYLAPGNHEMLFQPNPARLELYREIFGKDYFSFKHKGYTFVIVNSQLWKSPLAGETEKMDAWFRETLKEAKDANSPVFMAQHVPFFFEEPNEPEDLDYNLSPKKRVELFELMAEYGVIVSMSGHKHMNITKEYMGIKFVITGAITTNYDDSPSGFRLWTVESPENITNKFIPLEKPPEDPNNLTLSN